MMLMTIMSSSRVKPRDNLLPLAFLQLLAGDVASNVSTSWVESFIYQSLYFVLSSPVPSDLVKTSKTFCPPQESESGSSCIERKPHSLVFVMGSVGIER